MSTVPINTTNPRVQYVATAGQTVFPYTFWITADDDLTVYVNTTLQTLNTDYTVSGALDTSGGAVTFSSGLSADDVVTIERSIPLARSSEFQEAGTFKASVLNLELSKLIAISQQLSRDIARRVGPALTSTVDAANIVLPDPADGKALLWDGTTGAMKNSTLSVDAFDASVAAAATSAATASAAQTAAQTAQTGAETAQTAAEAAQAAAEAATGSVNVSSNDTTPGDLETKLLAGTGLSMSTANDGANETRTVKVADATAYAMAGFGSSGAFSEIFLGNGLVRDASTLAVNLASAAETITGTATDKAVTPAGFAANIDTSSSGYMKLPGGLIIQWGTGTGTTGADNISGAQTITFPVTFPTAALRVICGTNVDNGSGSAVNADVAWQVFAITSSNFKAAPQLFNAGNGTTKPEWIAIGN